MSGGATLGKLIEDGLLGMAGVSMETDPGGLASPGFTSTARSTSFRSSISFLKHSIHHGSVTWPDGLFGIIAIRENLIMEPHLAHTTGVKLNSIVILCQIVGISIPFSIPF